MQTNQVHMKRKTPRRVSNYPLFGSRLVYPEMSLFNVREPVEQRMAREYPGWTIKKVRRGIAI